MRVIFLDIDGFLIANARPRKVPYIIATLERLTAVQQGIRRQTRGSSRFAGQARSTALRHRRADRQHSPRPRQRDAAVSSGGQLVAGIELVGYYPAGNFYITSAVPSVSSLCSG
jgi:hypothetical protein